MTFSKLPRRDRWIINTMLAIGLWRTVPASAVTYRLLAWRCGTTACFGGHLATWPEFQVQGVFPDNGVPSMRGITGTPAYALFGDEDLFRAYGQHWADHMPVGMSDHALVMHRLKRNLEVLLERGEA